MNDNRHPHQDLRQSAIDCINTGRFEQAKLLCQQLCRQNGKDAESWFLLAGVHAQLGDIAEVTECCRRVIELQPENMAARYNLGVALQMQGRHAEAEKHYRAVVRTAPDNLPTFINLGLAVRSQGRPGDAVPILREALRIKPDSTDALNNLGLCHRDLREFENASACFRTALSIDPSSAQTLCNLGLCLLDQSQLDEAADTLRKALQFAPDLQDAPAGLATALIRSGRSQEAIEVLQQALSRNPRNPQLHYALGNACQAGGNRAAAISSYQSAIQLNPSHYEARNNLASLLQESGRLQEAESAYRTALQTQPNEAGIHFNLSTVLFEQGRIPDALNHCHTALQMRPDELTFRQHFIKLLGNCPPEQLNEVFDEEILRCFSALGVDCQYLAAPALARVRASKLFRRLETLCGNHDTKGINAALRKREFAPLCNDPHLHALLTQTVVCNAVAELALTALRKAFLLMLMEQWRPLADTEIELIAALACQCTNNEFAYYVDEEESALVGTLARSVEETLRTSSGRLSTLQDSLAVLSMYRPLSELQHKEAPIRHDLQDLLPTVRLVIERQLTHWATEQELRAQMPRLTRIQDGVSDLVRGQYEENPYPRWLGVDLLKARHYTQIFRSLFPHFEPPAFQEDRLDVLVAGCGTGKHAILSKTRFANSRHLAVDLSTASLAYAQRKAMEYNLDDLRFMQADILELAGIEQRFHIIESVGVLHHMADPGAGLEVLAGLLRPGGLMNIGLYSALARRSVSAMRSYYGERIASPTKDVIRELRRQIIEMPPDNPIRTVALTNDFYSLSDCRDMLFHVQEHCFSLPQIDALLKQNNLKFIGFEFPDTRTRQLYRNAAPTDPDMTGLERWDRFEQAHPDTFIGMYVFWCQKQ